MGEETPSANSAQQAAEQLKKIAEENQQEPLLKGIGREINEFSTQEDLHGLPFHIEFYRFTHAGHLKPGLRVMDAIQSAEEHMGIDKEITSTPIELVAVRQTVLTCLLLAEQLGLSPQEIAQNLKPQEGETPGKTLMRLIKWQEEMMEKIYQQK